MNGFERELAESRKREAIAHERKLMYTERWAQDVAIAKAKKESADLARIKAGLDLGEVFGEHVPFVLDFVSFLEQHRRFNGSTSFSITSEEEIVPGFFARAVGAKPKIGRQTQIVKAYNIGRRVRDTSNPLDQDGECGLFLCQDRAVREGEPTYPNNLLQNSRLGTIQIGMYVDGGWETDYFGSPFQTRRFAELNIKELLMRITKNEMSKPDNRRI